MKIALAQTIPHKGEVGKNVAKHLILIEEAARQKTDLILFPELSLTGYEPELASSLAFTSADDTRLAQLKAAAQQQNIVVVVGLPYQSNTGLHIASFIIFPDQATQIYTKQFLHGGEEKYFVASNKYNPLIELKGEKITVAICADITHREHAQNAAGCSANMYLASVLITPEGYLPDTQLLAQYAQQYKLNIFMANFGGTSGGFQSAGKSAAWSSQGKLIAQLNNQSEGLLVVEKNLK